MSAEFNLDKLLKNMDPVLHQNPYVFLTSAKDFAPEEKAQSIMIFKEAEGTTIITSESYAKANKRPYSNTWAFITLNIHSDLEAVGFLGAITKKLAEASIPVNAVSAFYHDHLFVPWVKRQETMLILQSFKNKL